ncbi:MAG: phosphoadenosine phosphosulfate reductase domain-containing protein [Candidatus Thorarchaeota archaeon]
MRLYWCDTCNVPRLSAGACSSCGSPSRKVEISPPGDAFPAMDGHLKRVIDAIDAQYGAGTGSKIIPSNKTVVMNKVASLDAMYEVVVDGYIIGRLRFDIPKLSYSFLLSIEGARRIGAVSRQKWVTLDDGVLKYLKEGANLMLPGVLGCDTEIALNDDVWVIDTDGMVVASGIARMTGKKMAQGTKGFAVKLREVGNPKLPAINTMEASWDDAVRANAEELKRIEDEAVSFVRRTVERYDLPVVVGFSGGKDSLVTYLVVERALNQSPPLFFMNTGLELPETVQFIKDFAKSRGVDIIGEDAGDRFWESIDSFGPPARDFRWCCKILKLGPAATAIAEKMGGAVLSFMGQRKLESFQRSIEPRVTENPWVPGQQSANPIQNWNALEVWLYTFREKSKFNPLYNRGYHRMGCYLCPASPLAELKSLEETHPSLYARWVEKLREWRKRLGFPEEWSEFGFWRWKTLPPGQMNIVESLGLEIRTSRLSPTDSVELKVTKGTSPCTSAGFSLEGTLGAGIDLKRLSRIMPIFGDVHYSEELGALRVKAGDCSISIFSPGSVVIRGDNEADVEQVSKQVERAVKRGLLCQACGSCVPQCPEEALHLRDGRISVDPERCVNCLQCDNWPCPTYLA